MSSVGLIKEQNMTHKLGRVLVVASLVLTACGGSAPASPGAPVNPHPAGESVEVGGWIPVQARLVDGRGEVEENGELQSGGWFVTLVNPGPCELDPARPEAEKGAVCIRLEIRSDSAQAGGMRIWDGLPMLSDAAGDGGGPTDVRIADDEYVGLHPGAGTITRSVDCTLGAPDAGVAQAADCAALVVFRVGDGMTSSGGWLTVGAGQTARYDLQFIGATVDASSALHWPDGTWFSLP